MSEADVRAPRSSRRPAGNGASADGEGAGGRRRRGGGRGRRGRRRRGAFVADDVRDRRRTSLRRRSPSRHATRRASPPARRTRQTRSRRSASEPRRPRRAEARADQPERRTSSSPSARRPTSRTTASARPARPAAAGERARSGLVRELLPVVDNLERALASAEDGEQHLAEGVRLVHAELIGVLERNGDRAVRPRRREVRPDEHEALSVPRGRRRAGHRAGRRREGLPLNGTVIRPARVVVSG